MTRAEAAPASATAGDQDLVRPFTGWLVRAEAAGEVGAMSEAAAVLATPRPVPRDAYAPMPSALYVYRQRTSHGEHLGVVCAITPEAFLDGRVLGHESVVPERVAGLARYLATAPQRVELVSTLHRAGPVLIATLARAPHEPPLREVVGPDGARHTVWRVPAGERTEQLCRELGAATHYIADGHHRVAASLQVWTGSGRRPDRGVLCVAYPLDGLRLSSFDRRVIGPVDRELVRTLLRERFDLRPAADMPGALATGVAVYLDRRWCVARFAGTRPPGSRGLDVSLLHEHVLDRLPAGTEVRPTQGDPTGPTAACDADGGAFFALPPPRLRTLLAIADAGEVVPAKSTFFSPKPGSGIFLRDPAGP